ncbi:uncharacterized protein LOC122375236 [Amphibalanus amphitrite]|uniref:uncharacterized protein LOC122375236 n=1 Tax=Amphibalanus amphitrite TaxID=1232801 RepID=UPI001C927C94|nr:uncharacterized protein LOC122375236 [Amphibalanus amphitrite]
MSNELQNLVSSKMVHGPCGGLNPRSACMADGACTKKFPRNFQRETVVPERSYPLYRCRAPEDGGFTTEPRGRPADRDRPRLDSRWVVPYNPFLLRAMKAHVNVEVISHSTSCVKYAVKYVQKGSDQSTYTVVTSEEGELDEVAIYQHCRYLGSMEASWRLLDLPIHEHHPTVEQLDLHLSDDDRRLQFRNDANLEAVLQNQRASKLTAFSQLCAADKFARTLLYTEKAIRKAVSTIDQDEARRACSAFRRRLERVRDADGGHIEGLLEDGEHWDRALAEATTSGYPNRLRLLFAIILTEGGATCDPVRLWAAHQPAMSEDITHRQELLRAAGRPCMSAEEIQHETLRRVGLCLQRLCGRTVGSFGLPEPPAGPVAAEAEPDFALDQQQAYLAENEHLLTADQRVVYDEVVRSQGEVAVAVATSGIAACLLDGGTTAHYRFKIPLRLHADENVCGIAQRTPEAELLQACRLIVWDEAAMANRRALEAVDRTMRDLRDTDEEFGGIMTVLSGDWRQILPVVRYGCRAQVVDACLKSSPLWNTVTVMQLETNMRVQLHQDARAAEFSDFLLTVGNGELPIVRELGEDVIDVPPEIQSPATSVAELAVRIFPDLAANYVDTEWLHQRAILTPRNSDVDKVNQVLMEMLPGATAEYRSIDSMTDPEAVPMPTEVLNSLELQDCRLIA